MGATSCTSVIQIGDSTSVNADVAARLPDPADTATAQYRRVGVRDVTVDALTSRAIVGGPAADAEHAVARHLTEGARGCWVIAMGVNDAGAISAGGIGADERIDRIMTQLAGQSVLWPTVASANPANPAFGERAMAAFNDALRRALVRYPNLAVHDWAALTGPEMFTDGIHYTAAATARRNAAFADALAAAFPAGGGIDARTRQV